MSGKGSFRRPAAIPPSEADANWERTFRRNSAREEAQVRAAWAEAMDPDKTMRWIATNFVAQQEREDAAMFDALSHTLDKLDAA